MFLLVSVEIKARVHEDSHTGMYDFYANLPSTRAQVQEYYSTWFQDVSDTTVFTVQGQEFRAIKSFVRAFHNHVVLQNVQSGAYTFVVFPREAYDTWFKVAKITQHPTYDEMFNALVEDTCRRWAIPI